MLRLWRSFLGGSFLGIQCSAPRTVIFLLRAAVVRKREIGGEMGSYSNAPLVAELPKGSFLGIQCSAPRAVIFLLRAAVVRKREIGGRDGEL